MKTHVDASKLNLASQAKRRIIRKSLIEIVERARQIENRISQVLDQEARSAEVAESLAEERLAS